MDTSEKPHHPLPPSFHTPSLDDLKRQNLSSSSSSADPSHPSHNTLFSSSNNNTTTTAATANDDANTLLRKMRTATTINLSPELFEKMYLNPQNQVKGDLRATFGNPTPIGLLGYLLCLSPLSCELMGWRGSGGGGPGIAQVGGYYFIGGLLMTLGGIMEWTLGNTFSFVVFCAFGGFFFTLGATLTPAFNAYGAYAPDPATSPSWDGITSQGFHTSYAFFLLFMGLMCLVFVICALRTNIALVTVHFGLMMTFVMLAGSYWMTAQGMADAALGLQKASGAFGFLACIAGWWIFLAQMFNSVDFPVQLPMGDISHVIKGGTVKAQERKRIEGQEVGFEA